MFSLFVVQEYIFQWIEILKAGYSLYCIHANEGLKEPSMAESTTLGEKSKPYRSMRDYRDQGISAPFYSVSPTYAPPTSPYYASTPQSQPPQSISPIERAILNLTKLVGDVVEEQKKFNAQLSKKIHTVENSLN